ncbi:SRPBCC family protein [Massilia sp. GCM10020059]|uniref:SRPBCC family protein n=1 Tax=Massilia agrisoli TaxID=2892444 RepID=A0ABS8IVJ0_9BURK|nr:SRPBCC family protein [Massilia agrisoli]MCC6071817.1 SRPBCC family protein [Massilia agrisoli]
MLKKLAIAVIVILAVILGMAAMQPDTFTVTRSITIQAPPEKIIPLVNDFRNWQSWSPWEKLDPAMQRTFSGAASGTGAVYAWKGNSDVGEGRMEITGQELPFKVTIKLDFVEPLPSSNVTEFALVPRGTLTTVNWTMTGPMLFVTKIMSVFTSMDKMIGRDFEKGLAQMKTVAEK